MAERLPSERLAGPHWRAGEAGSEPKPSSGVAPSLLGRSRPPKRGPGGGAALNCAPNQAPQPGRLG